MFKGGIVGLTFGDVKKGEYFVDMSDKVHKKLDAGCGVGLQHLLGRTFYAYNVGDTALSNNNTPIKRIIPKVYESETSGKFYEAVEDNSCDPCKQCDIEDDGTDCIKEPFDSVCGKGYHFKELHPTPELKESKMGKVLKTIDKKYELVLFDDDSVIGCDFCCFCDFEGNCMIRNSGELYEDCEDVGNRYYRQITPKGDQMPNREMTIERAEKITNNKYGIYWIGEKIKELAAVFCDNGHVDFGYGKDNNSKRVTDEDIVKGLQAHVIELLVAKKIRLKDEMDLLIKGE